MPLVEERSFFQLDKRKTYLVVDDYDTMRRVTVNQLKLLGAENILTANDGMQALRILRSQHVDMVLSDWNMPVMTGIDLLRTVRADERLFTLPFIMITAEAERYHVEQAVSSGVSAMLLKPYSPNQLGHRLERAVAAKHRRMAAVADTETSAPTGQVQSGRQPNTSSQTARGDAGGVRRGAEVPGAGERGRCHQRGGRCGVVAEHVARCADHLIRLGTVRGSLGRALCPCAGIPGTRQHTGRDGQPPVCRTTGRRPCRPHAR